MMWRTCPSSSLFFGSMDNSRGISTLPLTSHDLSRSCEYLNQLSNGCLFCANAGINEATTNKMVATRILGICMRGRSIFIRPALVERHAGALLNDVKRIPIPKLRSLYRCRQAHRRHCQIVERADPEESVLQC